MFKELFILLFHGGAGAKYKTNTKIEKSIITVVFKICLKDFVFCYFITSNIFQAQVSLSLKTIKNTPSKPIHFQVHLKYFIY